MQRLANTTAASTSAAPSGIHAVQHEVEHQARPMKPPLLRGTAYGNTEGMRFLNIVFTAENATMAAMAATYGDRIEIFAGHPIALTKVLARNACGDNCGCLRLALLDLHAALWSAGVHPDELDHMEEDPHEQVVFNVVHRDDFDIAKIIDMTYGDGARIGSVDEPEVTSVLAGHHGRHHHRRKAKVFGIGGAMLRFLGVNTDQLDIPGRFARIVDRFRGRNFGTGIGVMKAA